MLTGEHEPDAGSPAGRERDRAHADPRLPGRAQHVAQRVPAAHRGPGPGWTETDVHRVGAALQRRGLAAHKTQFGVTRWALTEAGLGQARALSRTELRHG